MYCIQLFNDMTHLCQGVHDSPPCAACWNPDWNPRPWRIQLSTVASVGTCWNSVTMNCFWSNEVLSGWIHWISERFVVIFAISFWGFNLLPPRCGGCYAAMPLCHTYCDVFWGVCKSDFAASDSLATCFFVGLPFEHFEPVPRRRLDWRAIESKHEKKIADIETKWNKTCQK